MNCWFWIILLWCCCGNGCQQNHCRCTGDCGCDKDSSCGKPVFPTPVVPPCPPPNNGCGCGNDMMQSRGFAGFGDNGNNTCGCEEKED